MKATCSNPCACLVTVCYPSLATQTFPTTCRTSLILEYRPAHARTTLTTFQKLRTLKDVFQPSVLLLPLACPLLLSPQCKSVHTILSDSATSALIVPGGNFARLFHMSSTTAQMPAAVPPQHDVFKVPFCTQPASLAVHHSFVCFHTTDFVLEVLHLFSNIHNFLCMALQSS